MINAYQLSKAKEIVKLLMRTYENTSLSRHQMAQCVALMSHDEWRTVCFAADQPVADLDAKAAVLALLRNQAPHIIGRKETIA